MSLFVLYDHCAAPAWPFGTKVYDASDFKLHTENVGYIGKDRFVGGARLAMMKRAWVMILSLILFGLCVFMRFLTFTGIVSSKTGEHKMFRSVQNIIEVLSVLFCGLYIISALSTLYQMRDCTMPEYLFDSEESGFTLDHVFPPSAAGEKPPAAQQGLQKNWTTLAPKINCVDSAVLSLPLNQTKITMTCIAATTRWPTLSMPNPVVSSRI